MNFTTTLKTAAIKMLRDGKKDPTMTGNYRPISLLFVFYKVASCAIGRFEKTKSLIIIFRQMVLDVIHKNKQLSQKQFSPKCSRFQLKLQNVREKIPFIGSKIFRFITFKTTRLNTWEQPRKRYLKKVHDGWKNWKTNLLIFNVFLHLSQSSFSLLILCNII